MSNGCYSGQKAAESTRLAALVKLKYLHSVTQNCSARLPLLGAVQGMGGAHECISGTLLVTVGGYPTECEQIQCTRAACCCSFVSPQRPLLDR
jgi:hypothetical protein